MRFLIALLFCIIVNPVSAASPCTPQQYQSREQHCIMELVARLNARWPEAESPTLRDHVKAQAIVGMFAVVFSRSPDLTPFIFQKAEKPLAKGILAEALYRAGKMREAQNYIRANNLLYLNNLWNAKIPVLEVVRPQWLVQDNDLLIGAYATSGDSNYLNRILENFLTADAEMARVAIRMALMQGKFGPTLTPKGRKKIIADAMCQKFNCKSNITNSLRLLTLSSGFWALNSLSKKDAAVQTTMMDFFTKTPQLMSIIQNEQREFGNYLTLLIAQAAAPDNPEIEKALISYENLGAAMLPGKAN